MKSWEIMICSGKWMKPENIIRQPRSRMANATCSLLFVLQISLFTNKTWSNNRSKGIRKDHGRGIRGTLDIGVIGHRVYKGNNFNWVERKQHSKEEIIDNTKDIWKLHKKHCFINLPNFTDVSLSGNCWLIRINIFREIKFGKMLTRKGRKIELVQIGFL